MRRTKCNKLSTVMVTALAVLFFFGSATSCLAATDVKTMKVQPGISATATKAISLNQAQQNVVTTLYKGRIGNKALFAHPTIKQRGARIASWTNPNMVVVDKDSWFFFVDEGPEANWEHKARYVLVDKTSGAVRSVAARTPPLGNTELETAECESGYRSQDFETEHVIH